MWGDKLCEEGALEPVKRHVDAAGWEAPPPAKAFAKARLPVRKQARVWVKHNRVVQARNRVARVHHVVVAGWKRRASSLHVCRQASQRHRLGGHVVGTTQRPLQYTPCGFVSGKA